MLINCKFNNNYNVLYRGSTDVTKQAHDLIAMLIKDPEVNIMSVIAKNPKVTSAWDKSVVITLRIAFK